MRLLIGCDAYRVPYLSQFGEEISKLGVEYRIISDGDAVNKSLRGIYNRSLAAKRLKKVIGNCRSMYGAFFNPPFGGFNELVDDFKPDAVFIDNLRHFGTAALKRKLPLIVYIRGDAWREMDDMKNTERTFTRNLINKKLEKIMQANLEGSRMIMPICKNLEEIVRKRFPDKPTHVLYYGADSPAWYSEKGMELKHPCVGLIQNAEYWDKIKEMLTLRKVLEKLPHVTFYWVGNGTHAKRILDGLEKYPNFKWLGQLDYPNEIRRFLSEIDVSALLTGMDALPRSLKEALLMERPVIATNTGGISEIIEDGRCGFLVEEGDSETIIEKILYLIENEKNASRMGQYGRKLMERKFSWNDIATGFIKSVKSELDLS